MGADPSKNYDNTNGFAQDLSERKIKEIQQQILMEYPFLTSIWESCLVTDFTRPDNPIIFANDQFERMTLYPKEEIIGKNCRFLQGEYTDPKTVTSIRNAITNGEALDVEILNYRKDGVAFWNNFMMFPVHKKRKTDGIVNYFIAIQKDVTLLRQAGTRPEKWTKPEVAMWLDYHGFIGLSKTFILKDIDGKKLMTLKMSDLENLSIDPLSERRRLLSLIGDLSDKPTEAFGVAQQQLVEFTQKQYETPAQKSVTKEELSKKKFWLEKPLDPSKEEFPIAFKCYYESKEPWMFRTEVSISLRKLRKRLISQYNNEVVIMWKGSDLKESQKNKTIYIESDDDLQQAILLSYGGSVLLHLKKKYVSVGKRVTEWLDHLVQPTLIIDSDNEITYCNAAFQNTVKKLKIEILRSPVENFIPLPLLKVGQRETDWKFIEKSSVLISVNESPKGTKTVQLVPIPYDDSSDESS
eukprot:TRINITY_DN8496_c0_g1_i1.p1 TRINITY_DN8496_c0_g1~~TRINITY_DN8496_c0_g1_i1.p1  ORF type:complete len:467 (-),score=96.11 TRINITY_DN8496_c0_g1_i1:13-1413(-)